MRGFLSIYKCGKELGKFLEGRETKMRIGLTKNRIGKELIQTYFVELIGNTNPIGISDDLICLLKHANEFPDAKDFLLWGSES